MKIKQDTVITLEDAEDFKQIMIRPDFSPETSECKLKIGLVGKLKGKTVFMHQNYLVWIRKRLFSNMKVLYERLDDLIVSIIE